ncbi:MAG: exosome complex RNA-binding protein Csl4 [Candidatus Diapherotrites archaeon]
MKQKDSLVFPGQFLGVEEEYMPGKNAYVDEDGRVFSQAVGISEFDEQNHEVNVQKVSKPVIPIDIGSNVVGKVSIVKENMVVVEIINAEKSGVPRKILQRSASIMISRASPMYVKTLDDLFKIGDLVKAKVVEVSHYGVELSTSDPSMGVLKAYCSNCRFPLEELDGNLKCPDCGSLEKRKMAKIVEGEA